MEEINDSVLKTQIKANPVYLHTLFQAQVEKNPLKAAVLINGRSISYAELEQDSNRLMWYLKQNNIASQDYVAILSDANDLAFIGMLAVLKLGGTYIPLDPEYPQERINYILKDSNAAFLITNASILNKNPGIQCPLVALDQEKQNLIHYPNRSLSPEEVGLKPNSTCYIIYTSGTTGKPKGVLIEHQSVCNYLKAAHSIYQIQDSDIFYQGFSLAFDASVEEIWLSFSQGATLCSTNDKAIRSGIGLIEFLKEHKISFFSTTPSLLATLEPRVPSLRLLILGGEVCQQDLLKGWHHPDLRIINTYGPTEATVVTTYCEYNPQKNLSIGKPLPNYEVFLLDKNLQPVDQGEEGEICIAGVSLAQGYINQPELNQLKFFRHLQLGNKRLYRTGDLAKVLTDGNLQYLGRIDKQIKLRGFRIELSEIESVILEFPGIRNAIVSVKPFPKGMESLIAYIIPAQNSKALDEESLSEFLRSRLPSYMMPSFFMTVEHIPLRLTGKIDYANLPLPKKTKQKNSEEVFSENEAKIACIWEEIFNRDISQNEDFFYDLGGHSLLAAQAISKLRKHPEFASISMLDIYQNPTISKLANTALAKKKKDGQAARSKPKPSVVSKKQYWLCSCLQSIGCYLQFAFFAWEFLAIFCLLTWSVKHYGEESFMTYSILGTLIVLMPAILLSFTIMMKWLLLGRIKAGEYKLWGSYYLRWWFFTRIQRTIAPLLQISGSPLMNLYCRLMGAKVGKNCYIGTVHMYAFDLLAIDDDSSINQEAILNGYMVEDGLLKIGTVSIGKRCFVGTRAVLNINTRLQDDVLLEDLSMLPSNQTIPKGQCYLGSPAKKTYCVKKQAIPEQSTTIQEFLYGIMHYFALTLVTAVYLISYLPGISIIDYLLPKWGLLSILFVAVPLASFIFILIFCLSIIILNKLLLGEVKPLDYPLKSSFFVRKWIIERFLDITEANALVESLYYPLFLKCLGAKIGKRVEISELPHVTPQLIRLDDESFTASAVMIGVPRVHLGRASFRMNEIGKRSFIGNTAVLPPGSKLGSHCLIGSLSIAPSAKEVKSHTGWIGSPPVFLHKRDINNEFSEKHTFYPSKFLFFSRAVIELIRIILPTSIFFAIFVGWIISAMYLTETFTLVTSFILFPLLSICILFTMAGVVISIKWLLLGRLKPGMKPLWSFFSWKRDIIECLHNLFIARSILEPLLGTPFAAWILRLFGAKIGKCTFINTSFGFAEYDLTQIGNYAAINVECTLLTHLYEDRIFKMGYVKIGDYCEVGNMSKIIYSSVMEENSSLGSLSLLMKGECLPANSCWEGLPSQSI